jgi:hypothetical protein
MNSNSRFETRTVPASERPKTFYTYFVTGRGVFPFDMLRYDRCYPADSNAAFNMDRTQDLRFVKLNSWLVPTIDRWSSFGWSVGFEAVKIAQEEDRRLARLRAKGAI